MRRAYRSINEAPRNFIYVPMSQHFRSEVTFYVRRAGPEPRVNELRQVVLGFNPLLPVIHTQSLETAATLSLLSQTIAAWVASSVGLFHCHHHAARGPGATAVGGIRSRRTRTRES